MKKKTIIAWALFFGVLVMIVTGIWMYFSDLGQWYNRVQAEMPSVKGKLSQLNHETLSKIQSPDGAIEADRKEVGGNYEVALFVGYTIIDSKLDVQRYYRTVMDRLGWELINSNQGAYVFSRYNNKNSCIEVSTFPPENKTYKIVVYQDFLKQDFSPKLPPDWYVNFREYGHIAMNHCP